ncbi:MAG: hypothetical protein KF811_07865 [Dokdonella sp.]|nr:hypothetical protein [Dokdonella sp.]
MMRLLWLFLPLMLPAIVSASGPGMQTPTTPEMCGVVFEVDGKQNVLTLPSLHVMEGESTSAFVLPKDAPSETSALYCARDTLLPAKYDYRVLLAGFPLAIVAPDDRKAVLELSAQNLIIYRMISGESSEDEMKEVRKSLNANQRLLDKALDMKP